MVASSHRSGPKSKVAGTLQTQPAAIFKTVMIIAQSMGPVQIDLAVQPEQQAIARRQVN